MIILIILIFTISFLFSYITEIITKKTFNFFFIRKSKDPFEREMDKVLCDDKMSVEDRVDKIMEIGKNRMKYIKNKVRKEKLEKLNYENSNKNN